MIIEVARIEPEGSQYEGEEAPGILELKDEGLIRAKAPVRYRLGAQLVSDRLIVRGGVDTTIGFACSRCGKWFDEIVSEPEFEVVREVSDKNEPVDLTPDIREAILLRFSNYPVCKPSCRGLCPRCGANLNRGICGCGAAPEDGRWGALDGLKIK